MFQRNWKATREKSRSGSATNERITSHLRQSNVKLRTEVQVLFPTSKIPTRPSKKSRSAATIEFGRTFRAERDSRPFVYQYSRKQICSRSDGLFQQMAERAVHEGRNIVLQVHSSDYSTSDIKSMTELAMTVLKEFGQSCVKTLCVKRK